MSRAEQSKAKQAPNLGASSPVELGIPSDATGMAATTPARVAPVSQIVEAQVARQGIGARRGAEEGRSEGHLR
jgi:hypothetical protein